jgi:hypothetical protein
MDASFGNYCAADDAGVNVGGLALAYCGMTGEGTRPTLKYSRFKRMRHPRLSF